MACLEHGQRCQPLSRKCLQHRRRLLEISPELIIFQRLDYVFRSLCLSALQPRYHQSLRLVQPVFGKHAKDPGLP